MFRWKQTPLHLAAHNGRLDINCEIPHLRDTNIPLHYAVGKGRLQVVQFFVEELKCPPNTRGQRNATSHQLAKIKGHHSVTLYLQKFQHSLSEVYFFIPQTCNITIYVLIFQFIC